MNKRFLPLLLVTLALTVLALAQTGEAAHAQGCTDPTGNPIPCPNPDKKTPTPVPPRATVTPTPTATLETIPTNTPLPISNPADDGVVEVKWSGTCAGVNKSTPCTDKLINACNAAGGTPDASFDDDADTTTITCTLPTILEPTPLPMAVPTEDGTTEGKKSIFCKDTYDGFAVEMCRQASIFLCAKAGGTYKETGVTGGIKITCSEPVLDQIDPASFSLAVPMRDDNWIGRCTEADAVNGSLEDCFNRFTCEDGTLITKVDLYSGDGTVYDFYCIPHKPTFPPGGWLPWITGFFGLMIGMLLPAVQKIRDAASRTARLPNNKNPDLMKSNEDQDPTAQKKAKRTEAEFSNKAEPTSQTREHVLLAKQDGEQGNSRPYRLFGDADGDSPPPPPPPPPQNNAPAEEEGMQLKAKRAEIAPQTREHILLANQPTDPSEAKSGSGGQKPPPPPPPPPPSGPTHTSVPISAGKPSLQDFHFSTMDPDENASLSGAKEQSDGIGGVRVASGDVDAAREQGDESAETGQPLKDRGSQLPPIGAGDGI